MNPVWKRAAVPFRRKDWAKRGLRKIFELGQRCGVDVLPRHFYSQVPDIRALRADRGWQQPHSLVGVGGTDLEAQLAWLARVCPPELARRLAGLGLYRRAAEANGAEGYGPVEADILYCVVHSLRPRRMLQVGAGATTWIALEAAGDSGAPLEITCVDPYPTPLLRAADAEGRIELLAVPVQSLPPERLSALGPGDVLFVDSTHTVSPGSDVNHVILEVLPRLAVGVLVHFHDITLPFAYGPALLTSDLFFWSESVLLHAYLADNPRFEIRLGCAMIHNRELHRAQALLPTYAPALRTERGLAADDAGGHFPSAMWLEVVGVPTAR